MSTPGEQLRAAREAKGLTLEDVERATRIRAKYLAALENNDHKVMVSPVQARGFLKNYAEHLGLDSAALLSQALPQAGRPVIAPNAQLPKPRPKPEPPPKRAAPPPPKDAAPTPDDVTQPTGAVINGNRQPTPLRRGEPRVGQRLVTPEAARRFRWSWLWSMDTLLGVLVTAALGMLLFWGAAELELTNQLLATPTRATVSLADATAAITQATQTPVMTPTEESPLPTARPNASGVNLVLRVDQRTWLRVVVDGAETFAGLLPPGDTREIAGVQKVEIWTANAGGTRILFNGQDQGSLGGYGDNIIRVFTPEGAAAPTPTVAP